MSKVFLFTNGDEKAKEFIYVFVILEDFLKRLWSKNAILANIFIALAFIEMMIKHFVNVLRVSF